MFGLGSQELLIILFIAFLIFGAKRLPELGKGLGESIRGFKKAMESRPSVEDSRREEKMKSEIDSPASQKEVSQENQSEKNPVETV